MSVWGPLDVAVGDRVKVACKEHDFFSMAFVRNRTDDAQDETKSLVHLEFDGGSFPTGLLAKRSADRAAEEPADVSPLPPVAKVEPESGVGEVVRF
jgi:hypothetical protein